MATRPTKKIGRGARATPARATVIAIAQTDIDQIVADDDVIDLVRHKIGPSDRRASTRRGAALAAASSSLRSSAGVASPISLASETVTPTVAPDERLEQTSSAYPVVPGTPTARNTPLHVEAIEARDALGREAFAAPGAPIARQLTTEEVSAIAEVDWGDVLDDFDATFSFGDDERGAADARHSATTASNRVADSAAPPATPQRPRANTSVDSRAPVSLHVDGTDEALAAAWRDVESALQEPDARVLEVEVTALERASPGPVNPDLLETRPTEAIVVRPRATETAQPELLDVSDAQIVGVVRPREPAVIVSQSLEEDAPASSSESERGGRAPGRAEEDGRVERPLTRRSPANDRALAERAADIAEAVRLVASTESFAPVDDDEVTDERVVADDDVITDERPAVRAAGPDGREDPPPFPAVSATLRARSVGPGPLPLASARTREFTTPPPIAAVPSAPTPPPKTVVLAASPPTRRTRAARQRALAGAGSACLLTLSVGATSAAAGAALAGAIAFFFASFFGWAALGVHMQGRWSGVLVTTDERLSLARAQACAWVSLTGALYATAVCVNVGFGQLAAPVTIASPLLALLASSLLAAGASAALESPGAPRRPRLADLFTRPDAPDVVDVAKVSLVVVHSLVLLSVLAHAALDLAQWVAPVASIGGVSWTGAVLVGSTLAAALVPEARSSSLS